MDFDPASGNATPIFDDLDGEDEADEKEEEAADDEAEAEDEIKMAVREAANLPEGFVEWEAVSYSALRNS